MLDKKKNFVMGGDITGWLNSKSNWLRRLDLKTRKKYLIMEKSSWEGKRQQDTGLYFLYRFIQAI